MLSLKVKLNTESASASSAHRGCRVNKNDVNRSDLLFSCCHVRSSDVSPPVCNSCSMATAVHSGEARTIVAEQ